MTVTRSDHERAFEAERRVAYPVVDAFEARMGYAIDRAQLEDAASVLACPVKAHAPNWQHGRVLYALARTYLASPVVAHAGMHALRFIDVGTAKGFSALCLYWAARDASVPVEVTSVDVISPNARVKRNTVAEVDGFQSLYEILAPWPEHQQIEFRCGTGAEVIRECSHVHLAYLDGKHSYDAVSTETTLLVARQQAGDLVVWDDVQIEGVAKAVKQASVHYAIEYLDILPHRRYAIGVRR